MESIFELTDHEVFVITARDGDCEGGQVATWIMPASLAPGSPRLVAVISPANRTHELIAASGRFVVNLLAEGQQGWLVRFGLRSGRDLDKLAGVGAGRTTRGLPVLPDTCGWAECVVVGVLDSGDRRVYLADVVEQRVGPALRPLRKREAFAALDAQERDALRDKARRDGARDRELLRALPPLVEGRG